MYQTEPKVKAGTAVIVLHENRLLTGIRKGSHEAGIRAFPGGHIDPTDMSLVQAGKREVQEEVGIKVRFRMFRGGNDFFTTFAYLGGTPYLTVYMVADYVSGGDWIDEYTLRGQEKDKCDRWDFRTLEGLSKSLGKDKTWIPLSRIMEIQGDYPVGSGPL